MTLQKVRGQALLQAGNAISKVTKCMQCPHRQQWSDVEVTGSEREVVAVQWMRSVTAELPAMDVVVTCSMSPRKLHERYQALPCG